MEPLGFRILARINPTQGIAGKSIHTAFPRWTRVTRRMRDTRQATATHLLRQSGTTLTVYCSNSWIDFTLRIGRAGTASCYPLSLPGVRVFAKPSLVASRSRRLSTGTYQPLTKRRR